MTVKLLSPTIAGHLSSTTAANGNVPSVVAGAGAGTTPPTPTCTGANDTAGTVNFGTGTTSGADIMVAVTFATVFAANPSAILLTPLNAATQALGLYVSFSGVTAGTGFKVGAANAPTDAQSVGTYSFMYAVIG